MENLSDLSKSIFVIIGAILGKLAPMVPFALICMFAAFLDCITAWRLAKRVKIKYPESKPHVKFESEKFFGVFSKFLVLFGCIILGFLIDSYIFPMTELYLPNVISGAFCFYELWSILENESSENPSSWAKVLQKVMINKASRYIDGLGEILDELNNKDKPLKKKI